MIEDSGRPLAETGEEAAEDRARLARRNRMFHTADGAAYWAGINAVSYNTVVPLFVSKLTDSPLLIGLVAVASQAGWYLPQLLTAGATEQISYKRPIAVRLGLLVERLPALLWPVAALLSLHSPGLALALFLGSYLMHFVGAGLIAPGWQDLIAHTFPAETRGRFFGLTTFLGTALGAIGGFAASRVLGSISYPLDFVLAFAFAAVLVQISWAFLALTREPIRQRRTVPGTQSTVVDSRGSGPPPARKTRIPGDAIALIRQDRSFARFLIVRTLMGLGTMGFGFVAVYAARAFVIPDEVIALYTVALLLGEAGGNLSAGLLADKRGHRFPLILGTGAVTAAFTIVWLANVAWWFPLVFLLMGYATGAGRVSGMMIAIEFAPADRTPSYTGLTSTLAGFGGLIAPLIGSGLAAASYTLLFAVCAAINLLAWLGLIVLVIEPRTRIEK